jgi:hypothetical protein
MYPGSQRRHSFGVKQTLQFAGHGIHGGGTGTAAAATAASFNGESISACLSTLETSAGGTAYKLL